MRRVAAVFGGSVVALVLLLPGAFAAAQGSDCSPAPCASSQALTPTPLPVVVEGNPSGASARAESSVLDPESSGAVAPLAVAAAGFAGVAGALGLAVRHRREALDVVLAEPNVRLEPARIS